MVESKQLAVSGSAATEVPRLNAFEFATGDPFQRESDYVSAATRVAPIEGSRPVFVDHKSGEPSIPPLRCAERLRHGFASARCSSSHPKTAQY